MFNYSREVFLSLFARRLECTCGIFLAASQEQLRRHEFQRLANRGEAYENSLAESRRQVPGADMGIVDPLTFMHIPACARVHLQECVDISRRESICDMVNLMQNPVRMKPGRRQVAPTLLRGSLLWSLSMRRLVCPVEYLLMQGLPSSSSAAPAADSACNPEEAMGSPFSADLTECMPEGTIRQMAGNAMHVQQVGATFLWVYALLAELHRPGIEK